MQFSQSIVTAAVCSAFLIMGCGKKADQSAQKPIISQEMGQTAPVALPQTASMSDKAVCILDGLALKDKPEKAGKWLASISFGEIVRFTGDSAKDGGDKDRLYYKVTLSDGKAGWTTSYGIVPNAVPGVVKMETVLYKRPDVVTATTQKFAFMTIVAVGQEKEGWVEVAGEGRKLSGWAKQDAISTDPGDVGAVILAAKAFKEAKDKPRLEVIKEIVANTPFPQSFFIAKLQEEINLAQAAPAPAATDEGSGEETSDSVMGEEIE
jgi:hypothetical protein